MHSLRVPLLAACGAAVLAIADLPSAQEGGSTFGHARTRAMAGLGRLPSPVEVAVADLVNFHRHRLAMPQTGAAVAFDLRVGAAGFDARGTAVLQFGLASAPVADRADLGPVHLALAIDCSGSMAAAGKLDVVKDALRTLVDRLRPADRVTIVGWSQTAAVLGSACRRDGGVLRDAIARLEPGGATNLHAGLMTAIDAVADHGAELAGRARVILLTDGIANRGVVEPTAILGDALERAGRAVDITTIGFGTDLNVDLLDAVARGARGTFHFVADPTDVAKVFVAEFESQIATAARAPTLEFELPEGVELVRVFGHTATPLGAPGSHRIELPHLNADATQVVLAVVRSVGVRPAAARTVRATLRWRDVANGAPRSATADRSLAATPAADRLADPEVRKNFVIARVADGMHRMAEHARAERWVEADRELQKALRIAERRFPSGDDADVGRLVDMANRFRAVLRGYLDRFRDA
jgi:Ca-activated chloride channel homolog